MWSAPTPVDRTAGIGQEELELRDDGDIDGLQLTEALVGCGRSRTSRALSFLDFIPSWTWFLIKTFVFSTSSSGSARRCRATATMS